MYCKNCGSEINENADFCINCGVFVKKQPVKFKKKNTENNGKSIASMILGVCVIFFALCSFDIEVDILGLTSFRKIGLIMNQISLQVVLATLSLIFGLMEIKIKRNGYNISGIILSLITFCLSAILFLFIIVQ